MVKFTDAFIRNLEPKPTRYDVREVDGFAVRVSPNGGKSFVFFYHFNGTKRRHTLGQYPDMTLKDAHAAHTAAKRALQNGTDPAADKVERKKEAIRQREAEARAYTFATLARAYLEHHAKPNKRTWAEDERMLERDALPAWGTRKAEDITARDVNRLLDTLKERGAPIGANRLFALIRMVFNFGIQRGELERNPCNGIPKPSREEPSDRALSPDEIARLWAGLDGDTFRGTAPVRFALRLILLTASRPGEVAGARWEEIDLEAGIWEIPAKRMKNKRPHRVWLNSAARAAFTDLKALSGPAGLCFPSKPGQSIKTTVLNRAIDRSLSGLGVAKFSPHDLRRTAATLMGEIGIAPHVIGEVLSHTDQSVTSVHYNKWSYDREKLNAMEALGNRIKEITEGKPQGNVIQLQAKRPAP